MKTRTCLLILLTAPLAHAFDFESLEKEVKTTAVAVVAACKKDKPKFCDKYKTLDEIKSCLKENEERLSPECKQSLHL